MPFAGYAAGLGKLNVSSGLGEPLKAEIELLSVTPDELSTLIATIASEEAYAAQGVTRLGIHNNIQIEVAKNSSGSPILRLRSSQPISDPYLDMLIQVDWSSGRLQREYTVLLDPPGYKQMQDSALPMAVSPAVTNAGNTSAQITPAPVPNSKKSGKSRRNAAPSQAQPDTAATDEVVTQRGDTLGEIAKQTQVEGVSLDQMLVGLYEQNKSAFVGGNINRLKVGQIIRVPSQEVLTGISKKEASQVVKIHSENWVAYRNNLAGAVAESPAMVEAEQKQAASGKIGTAEDKATPTKTGPQDVVKLSAGEKNSAAAGSNNAKEFEAKITALQEETTAREKSLKEAQDRTAALEKQIQDMQKLLALKSQAMTEAQKNAEAAAQVDNAAAATPEAAAPTAPATPAAEATSPVEAPVTESPATTQAPVTPEPAQATPTPVPAPVQTEAAPPVEPDSSSDEGFLASITNLIDTTVMAAIAGVALLAGIWMYLRNKRRRDLDSFERGILTSGGLRANTVFGNTTGTASTSDTSFLTDFAQSADGSMIDTNDVDPIAEAEVYMAYGRDAQAEEILKDAISKEPKRYELHLKLLEMYAARKDTSAFEAIAGELYTTLGADDPTWIKVAEIGHTMEPENPLYDVSGAVASNAAATQQFDAADFSTNTVKADTDLDFSLGDELEPSLSTTDNHVSAETNDAIAEADSSELSFDIGSFEPEPQQAQAEEAPAFNAASSDNTMDFDLGDFNLNAELPKDEAVTSTEEMPAFDLPESNIGSFEAPSFEMPEQANDANNEISFDMDFNLPDENTHPMGGNTINDLSFETNNESLSYQPEQAGAEEISFDLPAVEDNHLDATNEPANSFDLSTISLDLNETPAATPSPLESDLPSIEMTEAQPESADVDIKLDLVAAYLDMDDKEGARELLEEVLKDGGPMQQAKAKDLMANLN